MGRCERNPKRSQKVSEEMFRGSITPRKVFGCIGIDEFKEMSHNPKLKGFVAKRIFVDLNTKPSQSMLLKKDV